MPEKNYDTADDFLKDPTGDITKLRKMGITDFAIITYAVRLRDGKSKEQALRGLLAGRSLDEGQVAFVKAVLDRLPIR